MGTHDVFNQPPPLQDYDPLARDRALAEALRREGAAWAEEEVAAFGRRMASREAIEWGFLANQSPPRPRVRTIAAATARAFLLFLGGRRAAALCVSTSRAILSRSASGAGSTPALVRRLFENPLCWSKKLWHSWQSRR